MRSFLFEESANAKLFDRFTSKSIKHSSVTCVLLFKIFKASASFLQIRCQEYIVTEYDDVIMPQAEYSL